MTQKNLQKNKEKMFKNKFKIFKKIQSLNNKCLKYEVTILSAEYLSNCSFRIPDAYNLNEISHDAATNLIYKLLD